MISTSPIKISCVVRGTDVPRGRAPSCTRRSSSATTRSSARTSRATTDRWWAEALCASQSWAPPAPSDSTILGVMRERSFPADEIVPFASERSAGRTIDYGDQQPDRRGAVRRVDPGLRPRAVLRRLGRQRRVGAEVRRRRRGRRRQLVAVAHARRRAAGRVRGQPGRARRRTSGIVANPNCSTMQMVVALKPILDAVGIERLVVSTYQSVSGTGQRAVEELHAQAQAVVDAKELPPPSIYPHQIAFNVLPQVEKFKDGDDYTTEERKMMGETRKILGARRHRDLGDLRARARVHRPLGVDQRPDARPAVAGGVPRAAVERARRDRRRRPRQRRLPAGDRRGRPRRGARRPHPPRRLARRAASTSGSSATTCARARRRTRCRWRSC